MAGEKTEEATEHRLAKARDEGRVAKSLEFNAVVMLLCILALVSVDFSVTEAVSGALQYVMYFTQLEDVRGSYGTAMSGAMAILMGLVAPLLLLSVLVAVVANLVQIGFVFSVKSITPDAQRINPIGGFKKIFNSKSLYDIFRILLKLLVGYAVYYFWLADFISGAISISESGRNSEITNYTLSQVVLLLILLLGVLAVSALVDVLYTRKKYRHDMKMSKQEIKEENKSRDGDPEIKSKRKKYMTEILKNAGVYKKVEDSDFVLVNPVHFAVLVKYDRNSMVAPMVIGKARGAQVALIKGIARRKGVEVVQNVSLTRRIFFSTKVDGYIPLDSYEEVAKLYKRGSQV